MAVKLSDKAQIAMATVIAKFQTGDLSPIANVIRLQHSSEIPSAKWSLGNLVLAYAATGEIDCRGFKQWESAGRKVKKGAKAAYILGPRVITEEKDGEEKSKVVGFFTIPVFSSHDTEGEGTLPSFAPAILPPLAEKAAELGIKVEYKPIPDALGEYILGKDEINLGTHAPQVFFHELAHAIHARIENLLAGQLEEQEIAAELTAAVIMEMYNLPHTGNAWRYIKTYSSDPLTAVYKAIETVGKILAILGV